VKYFSAVAVTILLLNAARADGPMVPARALFDYVQQPDDSYSWKQRREGEITGSKFVELTLTSQTWRETAWRHQLFIIHPSTLREPTENALLFITGGSWKDENAAPTSGNDMPREALVFAALAEQIQSPVAVLLQVPFQPLFDGKYEDEIIAYTFERFMRTGDDRWPLLLPMVKSAVRAMDATQQLAKDKWNIDLKYFTVTGASKRGWTTWLTGAIDPRVKGIAPMVIDMLNMDVQMRHQLETWGTYSQEIEDYTRLGLQDQMDSEPGKLLRAIVDPYSYRAQLLQPKLIILGTNDEYWTLDALNNYWNDLQGPKYVLYIPNNDHGLKDLGRITGSLTALQDHVAIGTPLPDLKWDFASRPGTKTMRLSIRSDQTPKTVQAWIAHSPTKDFRPAHWSSVTCDEADGAFHHDLEIPTEGYVAMFGEAIYNGRAAPFYLSTNVRILSAVDKP